jgi:hypothetical protein
VITIVEQAQLETFNNWKSPLLAAFMPPKEESSP